MMTEPEFTLISNDKPKSTTDKEQSEITSIISELFNDDWPIEDLSKDEIEERISNTHENPDPGWDAMTAQFIKASCAFTAQELLRGPPEPPYNGKFLIGDHHLEWDELIVKHKRLCILAARNHGKTFYVDFAYPIWKIINNPRQSGFIFSSTQDQAERILGDIKEEIESNPKLQWLVPKVKEKWGSRLIRCSNGHRIYARGFGTKVRGAHPAWIVVDDGLTDETQYSEMVRRKQKDYFYAAITNMINPGGQILVIGTPLHSDDLYADLKKNPEYHYCEYPAESNPGQPDNKALWSARFSLEDLARIKREIGIIMYTREFLCCPTSDEMSLFPLHLFQGTDIEQFNLVLGMPLDFWKEAGIQTYMGVDFAMSSNVAADYTVIWVIGIDSNQNRWIIEMERAHGLPYQQQLSLINTLGRKYEPALIHVEDNQMQRIFGDELIRTSDLPIAKFTTGVQRNSLDKGVPSLRVLLENGKIKIPRGNAETIEKMDIWINEMRGFTWLEGKLTTVGAHDDTVMSFWITDQAIRKGGFEFSFGDDTYVNQSLDDLMKELTGETEDSEDGEAKQSVNNNPAVQQGWVPKGCTLEFPLILALMNSKQDPCDGCNEDRTKCGGRTKFEANLV
jgi:hypothetical protein